MIPAATSGRSPSWICAAVFSALPGVTARSPQSTSDWLANTSMPSGGCHGRSSSEAARIASGPKRAPGRKLVAVSNGTPTTAASTPSGAVTCGNRANVRTPV